MLNDRNQESDIKLVKSREKRFADDNCNKYGEQLKEKQRQS